MSHVPAGIPRYRPTNAPALFKAGYRPFFLGAASWAILSLVLWLMMLVGWISLPTSFDPLAWHTHEMIYGFIVAAIAGFLLTAIPNWTGRFPLQGAPLIGLVGLWLAGRIAMATSALIGALPAALVDLSFLSLFLLAVLREIVAGKNWRNLPAVAALFLLLGGNAVTHLEAGGYVVAGALGSRIGLAVAASMVALVGGRLIPSFTRNYLAKRRSRPLPAPAGWVDRLALAIVPAALTAWAIEAADWLQSGLLLVAAAANGLRLLRWRGMAAWRDPLLCTLHLGYAWLPIGLALLGLSHLGEAVPETAGLHALGVGAAGTMILAVMSRATLANAGRLQSAGAGAALLFGFAHSSALLRVMATLLPSAHTPLLIGSAAAWIAAFAMFGALYGAHLISSGRTPLT